MADPEIDQELQKVDQAARRAESGDGCGVRELIIDSALDQVLPRVPFSGSPQTEIQMDRDSVALNLITLTLANQYQRQKDPSVPELTYAGGTALYRTTATGDGWKTTEKLFEAVYDDNDSNTPVLWCKPK